MSPTRMQTAIHETGHAILLTSCGLTDRVWFSGIEITADETSRGRNSMSTELFQTTGGVEYPTDPAVCAAFALVAFGGNVAEQLFGFDGMGITSDQHLLAIQLIALAGAPESVIERVDYIFSPSRKFGKGQFTAEVQEFESYMIEKYGAGFSPAFEDVKKCASERLSKSKDAISKISNTLLETNRLDAHQINYILRRSEWCGVCGIPTILGFYPPRRSTWL